MDKRLVVILVAALVAVFGFSGMAFAASEMPDGPIALTVEGQTKPLKVEFNHDTHKAFKCVECHHVYKPDDKGEYPKDRRGEYKKLPENHYQEGQEVQYCKECHKLESDKKTAKKMKTGKDTIRSLEDAFHGNCVACHRLINKNEKLKGDDAHPYKCNDCHEK